MLNHRRTVLDMLQSFYLPYLSYAANSYSRRQYSSYGHWRIQVAERKRKTRLHARITPSYSMQDKVTPVKKIRKTKGVDPGFRE
jgi:hypothetical protein